MMKCSDKGCEIPTERQQTAQNILEAIYNKNINFIEYIEEIISGDKPTAN